jgi:hypothetical protein
MLNLQSILAVEDAYHDKARDGTLATVTLTAVDLLIARPHDEHRLPLQSSQGCSFAAGTALPVRTTPATCGAVVPHARRARGSG